MLLSDKETSYQFFSNYFNFSTSLLFVAWSRFGVSSVRWTLRFNVRKEFHLDFISFARRFSLNLNSSALTLCHSSPWALDANRKTQTSFAKRFWWNCLLGKVFFSFFHLLRPRPLCGFNGWRCKKKRNIVQLLMLQVFHAWKMKRRDRRSRKRQMEKLS